MCDMQKMKNTANEGITVIAIYLPNVAEIPFEKNREALLVQYQRFFKICHDIMLQEARCSDFIVCNHYIYGIFTGYCEDIAKIIASRIKVRLQEVIYGRTNYPEQLIYGMGIATGGAVPLSFENLSRKLKNNSWLGPVFDNAFIQAQKALDKIY